MFVVSKKSFTSEEFCTGCNYTIAIEIEKDSIVLIDGKGGDEITEIKIKEKINEGILPGESFIY